MFMIMHTNSTITGLHPNNYQRLLIIRQNGIESITDGDSAIRMRYIECEQEIKEGVVPMRNHIIAVFRYGANGDCLEGYTQKGSL